MPASWLKSRSREGAQGQRAGPEPSPCSSTLGHEPPAMTRSIFQKASSLAAVFDFLIKWARPTGRSLHVAIWACVRMRDWLRCQCPTKLTVPFNDLPCLPWAIDMRSLSSSALPQQHHSTQDNVRETRRTFCLERTGMRIEIINSSLVTLLNTY